MNHNEIVAREGWIFIAFFLGAAAALYYFTGYWGAVPAIILALFCTYFFRNPERTASEEEAIVVSPADGRIMDIEEVAEDRFIHGQAIRVRIFLSLFNVHINRNPVDAEVVWVQKIGSKYLPAYKPEAGTYNVRNYLGLDANGQKILLVQITGLVARRLVCWVSPGDRLQRGERFGLIRFGSCVELYLPTDVDLKVKAGDKVKGGETDIAKLPQ
ncbi:MAG: phosphatidylserine decarboxylase family protein [Syntrophomonadaceae bacterium]|nr:phosphatidylserine decarboxylase family protein [Syntrophomonadaceae bacterium]